MNRPALALLSLAALALATTSVTLAHGGPAADRWEARGDRIDQRLDLRGNRIDQRLDDRADAAAANGHPLRAERLDRRGDRIDQRLDLRGNRLEHRANLIGHRRG
ncbi:MAG: hypothetical protein ACK5VV_02375 [Lysobacteraceae bacterium]|jgi:hypothetical protein|nr:hypothetical protein [Silanimonas sp.]